MVVNKFVCFVMIAVLFGEVLRGSCTLVFQTSCKIAAVGTIFNSAEYQNCTSILSYGPPRNAPEKCADQTMALQIYSSTIDAICNQELDDLPAASLQSTTLTPSPSPPSKSGKKKAVEKGIQTEQIHIFPACAFVGIIQ